MKNKFLIILAFLSIFTISCEDAIDIKEPGVLSDDVVFTTVASLRSGLNGLYITLDNTQDMYFNSNYTDEVTRGTSNGGQGADGFNMILAPNFSESSVFWSKYYTSNMIAQRLLENAARITPTAAQQSEYNDVVGSIRAISAYCHFMLAAYYSTSYTDNNALAVPLVNFVPSVAHRPLRDNVGLVFDFVDSELIAAQALIPNQTNTNFISKDFCIALRARLAAFRQNYTLANTLASDLASRYPLANTTQYNGLFGTNTNTAEVIFQFARTVGDRYDRQSGAGGNGTVLAGGRAGNVYAFTGPGAAGGPFLQMSRALYNMYDATDIRRDVYLHPTSLVNPTWNNTSNPNLDRLIINKYQAKSSIPLMGDIKIFRASEMHMIMIEAAIHNNQLGPAATMMKNFRDVRHTSPTALPSYASQQEAYFDLLNEKRREFAFEGHRWFDLKRLGQRANQGISRAVNEATFWGWAVTTLPATDFRFTLPIPQAEFDGNPAIASQQNPGY
jgi:hypothetical protein